MIASKYYAPGNILWGISNIMSNFIFLYCSSIIMSCIKALHNLLTLCKHLNVKCSQQSEQIPPIPAGDESCKYNSRHLTGNLCLRLFMLAQFQIILQFN